MKTGSGLITRSLKKITFSLPDKTRRYCRGSAEQVLILVILTAALVIPLGVSFNSMMQTWYSYRRAQQIIEQILPSASLCLDPDDLSEGRLRLSYAHVETILNEQLERNTPAFLQGLLQINSVQIEMIEAPLEKINWSADSGPHYWPVIICHAEFIDRRGNNLIFSRSVSFVIE